MKIHNCWFDRPLVLFFFAFPLLLLTDQVSAVTLFSDDFNDGEANGWIVVNDAKKKHNPDWRVVGDKYTQTTGGIIHYSASYHRGTYAYYNGGLNLTNYELNVNFTPTAGRSVGVMFRYQNNSNYYRFSISREQGFSRLERKLNGNFKTLGVSGRVVDPNQAHALRIEANGPNLLVYLDGEPLLGARDTGLTKGTVALFAQNEASFDNVVVNTPDGTPKVILTEPASGFVETSGTLKVAAIAVNVPSGGGVKFVLDNGASRNDLKAAYETAFYGVALSDHTVDVQIIDRSKQPLPDPAALDNNAVIGAQGEYFLSLGDSITYGTGDDIASDNDSSDGRNLSQGYTPILNGLLSGMLGKPVTVINEGIGGTQAGRNDANGVQRAASTRLRHLESRYWLIQFGTNDTNSQVPSGVGLMPGNPGYSGSFKDYMQRIINNIKGYNKVPLLAKVPFVVNAPSARDQLIQEYNQVIDELVVRNNIQVTPPDFYAYFKSRPEQLPDNVHPNGEGYQAMAQLWFNALIGSGILQ